MNTDDDTKPEDQRSSFALELPNDRQEDHIPGTRIPFPSKAYDSFHEAYTYRLSELIFGSLLASYILGFVSFAAKSELPSILQDLSISITFCYLTASYYVTYHNTILTMPHFYVRGLRFDFFIAILQAILFGLSMIWPGSFLMCLAVSLFSVFTRQTIAYTQLASVFEAATAGRAKGQSEWSMDFLKHKRFLTAIKEVNSKFDFCLNGWLPIARHMWIAVLLLMFAGCFLAFAGFAFQLSEKMLAWIQVAVNGIISMILLAFVNRIFKDRAQRRFVYQLPDYKKTSLVDLAAVAVVERLRQSN